jgi:CHAT domain-containing protein/Tfp pilus assembly protein PilF
MKNNLNAMASRFIWMIGIASLTSCKPSTENLPLSQGKVLPSINSPVDTPASFKRLTVLLQSLLNDRRKSLKEVKAIEQFVGDSMQQDQFAGDLYHQIGLYYNNVHENQALALPCFEKGLKIRVLYLDSLDEKRCRSNIMVGTCHTLLDAPRKAIPYLDKALEMLSKTSYPEAARLKVKTYLELGGSYLDLGETDKSIDCLENGLTYKPSMGQLAEYHNRLGNGYGEKKQFEEAIRHYKTACALYEDKPSPLIGTLTNLANRYRLTGKIDSALQCLNRCVELNQGLKSDDTVRIQKIASAYIGFGDCYQLQKKVDLAKKYYQKAIDHLQKKSPIYPSQLSEAYEGLGDLAVSKAEKLKYYHQSVGILIPELATIKPDKLPNGALSALSVSSQGVKVLSKKAKVLYELNKESPKYNLVTAATYRLLDSVIIDMAHSYQEESDQFKMFEQTVPIYEKALALSIQEQDTAAILRYFERNKAFVLRMGLFNRAAKRFAGIPATILAQEHDLAMDVAFWRKKTIDHENRAYRDSLLDAKRRLNDFVEKDLKKNPAYKAYYHAKYEKYQTITLEILRESLKDSMAILSYYMGRDSIYTLTISKQKMDIQRIQMPDSFEQRFYTLRNTFRYDSSATTERRRYDFERLSPLFYDWLLRHPLAAVNSDSSINRLKIIPDGVLGYLPFGLLQEKTSDWRPRGKPRLDFLIQRYAISYEYSLSLMSHEPFLDDKAIEKHLQPSLFGGWGVKYDDFTIKQMEKGNKLIEKLENSPWEVREIQTKIGGNIFTDDQWFKFGAAKTDKQTFLKEMHNHQILHLSMHAALNDKNPLESGLIFTKTGAKDDNFLTIGELYAHHFNRNDLTVLSACNTGNGKLYRGEGIISLTRAITLAGAASVLSTLWSVGDKDMSIIMPRFYENLQRGMEKDIALQQAQIAYLHTKVDLEPSRWAAPILTGNLDALKVEKASFWQK